MNWLTENIQGKPFMIKYFKIFKKFLFVLLIILFFSGNVFAKPVNILVVSDDIMSARDNYFGFEEVSQIIAADVINLFNKRENITSPDLYNVREVLNSDTKLKPLIIKTLEEYQNKSDLSTDVFKKALNTFKCKYILIISSGMTNSTGRKSDLWDILDMSCAFAVPYPAELSVTVSLIDVDSDTVIWYQKYSKKVSTKNDLFSAASYPDAVSLYENIRMYSSDVISKDISQNVVLRLFPKSLNPVGKFDIKEDEPSGDILRYERTIPVSPAKPEPDKIQGGEMIFGL